MAEAPNESLRTLAELVGEDETRELVRIYLSSVPRILADIASADRELAHRAAHSLKSSSYQMGLAEVSEQAKEIELRLHAGGSLAAPYEITLLTARLKKLEPVLRAYSG